MRGYCCGFSISYSYRMATAVRLNQLQLYLAYFGPGHQYVSQTRKSKNTLHYVVKLWNSPLMMTLRRYKRNSTSVVLVSRIHVLWPFTENGGAVFVKVFQQDLIYWWNKFSFLLVIYQSHLIWLVIDGSYLKETRWRHGLRGYCTATVHGNLQGELLRDHQATVARMSLLLAENKNTWIDFGELW